MKFRRLTLLALVTLAILAFANTQGPLGSGSGTSPGGWVGPTNTAANEQVYATKNIIPTGVSGILDTNSLLFSIPAGATINGIQVSITAHCSRVSSCDLGDVNASGNIGIQMTKSIGVGAGTGKVDTTTWATTDSTFNYGTTSDLWGTTWAASDINASGFGVNVNVENQNGGLSSSASVDSILVTVTFTPAVSSSSGFLKMFGLYKKPLPISQTRGGHTGA